MNCEKCGMEMLKGRLTNSEVWLDKKIMGMTHRSTVTCYVCPKCGHIEFFADNTAYSISNSKKGND